MTKISKESSGNDTATKSKSKKTKKDKKTKNGEKGDPNFLSRPLYVFRKKAAQSTGAD